MKRTHRRTLFFLTAVLIALVTVLAGPVAAQADGEIDIAIEPETSGLEPGETGTYEVIVEGADGGIGAYDDVVVDLSDPGVADIVGFDEQFDESAGFTSSNSEIRNNNATLYLEAVTGESFASPADEIVVATFELQVAGTASDGDTTGLTFDSAAAQTVADFENIEPYDVAAFQEASVTVSTLGAGEVDLAIEPATSELEPGQEQTYEVVVRGADGGIGAYDDVVVDLSDSSVGNIVSFDEQFNESAGFTSSNSEIRNNNATLYLEAVTGESFTAPGFEVVIATFDLEAAETASDGDTTDIAFDSTAAQTVADFDSIEPYDVVEFEEANMTVSVDFPANLELASVDAPEAIQITDDLDVEYTLENLGDATGVESAVELVIDIVEPTVEDVDTDVAVGPGGSVDGTLVFEDVGSLSPGVTIEYTVQLSDFNDSTSGTSTITDGEPDSSISDLDIAGQGTDATITEGQNRTVSLDVTNTGDLTDEFDVELTVYDDNFDVVLETNTSTAELDPDDSGSVTFEDVTGDLEPGDYQVSLVSSSDNGDHDGVDGNLTVEEGESISGLSGLDIAGQGSNATVVEGAAEPVSIDVTNVGDKAGGFEVELVTRTADGERVPGGQQERATETLAPDETETVVFENATEVLDPGTYTVNVTTVDDTVSGELAVEEQQSQSALSNLDIAGEGSSATVVEGTDADIAVDVENVGEDAGTFDVTLAVSTDTGVPAGESEQTTGVLGPGETETVVFADIVGGLDPGGYVLDVTTIDDGLSGELTVESTSESLLSALNISGDGSVATLIQGETADVSVDVTNALGAADTFEVTLQVGSQTAGTETTALLDPGQSETVTFTGVAGDRETGQYDVTVSASGDSVTGSLTVAPGVDVTGDGNPATDTLGDGLLDDVDGDGEFDIFDVQALFTNLDASAVQGHPELFNFNKDETPSEVTIFDVQALFGLLSAPTEHGR